ncbi:MAG: crossover junction endodeoxyribonuclease RuvC [Parachlamydiales bacterium]|nr:crossover junction endodeoxyribonuclease RuvC [Parachlamydiales bacterium]
MPSEIILGIDPGTRITGYGILRMPTMDPIDFGIIRPTPQLPLAQRYLIIYESVISLIRQHSPVAISIETQFVKKNAQSAMKLGMARGMIILAAAQNNIPLFEYAPKKAKLAVVGIGSASKRQVQKMVQMLLHLPTPPSPEDAADALALAICHAHTMQRKELCMPI